MCRAAPAIQESTVPTEELRADILRALSQLQESIEQNASDNLAEPNSVLVLLVFLAVATFFVVDDTTGIVDEALELFQYDRNPRFLPVREGEGEGGGASKPVRRLGRADALTTDLMLKSGDEARLTVPVKEQLVLEQVVRRTAIEVDARERQITFLLLTWALFTTGTEAFFRTPAAPLQP